MTHTHTHTHTQFWRTRKTCKIVAHSKILYYFIFQKISRRNKSKIFIVLFSSRTFFYTPAPRRGRGYTVLPLSVLPSVQDIFRRIFLRNCWWQKSDILSQASYRYTILWEAFLDPSDSYFLFADFVDFYTHWTYMYLVYAHFSSHFSQQLLMAEIWYLVTSFI